MSFMSRKLAAVLMALVILNFARELRAQPVETNLVRLNAAWRYNHADCLVGTAWTATNYDDTIGNWLSGPGGFTGGETRPEALLGFSSVSGDVTPSSSSVSTGGEPGTSAWNRKRNGRKDAPDLPSMGNPRRRSV